MKVSLFGGLVSVACALALLAVPTGCQKKSDPNADLQRAAQAMEQTDASQAAAAPQTPPPPPPANPAGAQAAPPVGGNVVAQQMNQAMTSYQGGNYVDAVTRLQWLRASAPKTPDQAQALQDAIASVMGELYARAARGDATAAQAVKQYEQYLNSRH